jgi:D-alanine-D-alanine ligase
VHGKNVEDGSLAGFFKILDVAYAGSEVLPAALLQNKYHAKKMLALDGIPVLPCRYYTIFDYKERRETLAKEMDLSGNRKTGVARFQHWNQNCE